MSFFLRRKARVLWTAPLILLAVAEAADYGQQAPRATETPAVPKTAPATTGATNPNAPDTGGYLLYKEIFPDRPKPEPPPEPQKEFTGVVGDFDRSHVELIVDQKRYRVPREKFDPSTLIRPNESLTVSLTDSELTKFEVKQLKIKKGRPPTAEIKP